MAGRRKRTTSRPEGASVPPKPAVAPATPGGPNRLARKEEARRQRAALQRKMSRRRTYRVVSLIVAFVLVAGGIVAFVVLRPTAAEAAGCGPVRVIPPYNPQSEDRTHIGQAPVATPPPLSTYSSVPPTSGPHDPHSQAAGVYSDPPPIYMALHSLEHATYGGHLYGTPAAPVEEARRAGHDILLKIEVQGAEQVKEGPGCSQHFRNASEPRDSRAPIAPPQPDRKDGA